ncbi:glucodextranase DOMON-like domain-containing protein [Halapricum sp. CBA1109]|uniref:glucodextranase DOMON-like domain-containing protein n=1 Tax=Halapricum sp. CBA1109 TaxID=2668068 RepID=UPI0018D209C9|nr:glucodextranase DOMON-like domain-containing protein [Halapricum sp. CBA1109]
MTEWGVQRRDILRAMPVAAVAGMGSHSGTATTQRDRSGSARSTDRRRLGTVPDPVGDDDGPGGYQYPTAEEFKDGVYDMTEATIYDEGDAWTFEVGIAGPVENTYLFETGFGVQVIELYIRDPDAGDEVPASTQGRPGSGLTFAQPWHYVAHVTGTGQVVEDASSDAGAFDDELGDPEVLASDEDGGISASASSEGSTISFTVSKDALGGGDIREKEAGLFVFSLDGFTPSEIRTNVGEEADLYRTGLGDNPARNSPKAFDMLDPEGTVSQSEALDYTEDEPATVPLFTIGESLVTSVGMIPDSVGDDDGPGGYQYPTAEEFTDGAYDITRVRVYEEDDVWTFEVGIAGPVENIYQFDDGFAVQTLQLYVHDPSAGDEVPTSTQGRPGSGLTFAEPWHYLVHVTGYDQVVEDASSDAGAFDDELGDPEVLASREEGGISASASAEDSTISFTVSKHALGGGDIEAKKIGLFVFSQDASVPAISGTTPVPRPMPTRSDWGTTPSRTVPKPSICSTPKASSTSTTRSTTPRTNPRPCHCSPSVTHCSMQRRVPPSGAVSPRATPTETGSTRTSTATGNRASSTYWSTTTPGIARRYRTIQPCSISTARERREHSSTH